MKNPNETARNLNHAYSVGNIFDSTNIRLLIEYLLHKCPVYLDIHL